MNAHIDRGERDIEVRRRPPRPEPLKTSRPRFLILDAAQLDLGQSIHDIHLHLRIRVHLLKRAKLRLVHVRVVEKSGRSIERYDDPLALEGFDETARCRCP